MVQMERWSGRSQPGLSAENVVSTLLFEAIDVAQNGSSWTEYSQLK